MCATSAALRGLLRLRRAPLAPARSACSQRREIRRAAAGSGEAGFDIGKLGLEPRGALLVIVQRRLQLIAPRRQIGERAGQFGEGFFRRRERRFRRGDALVDAAQAARRSPALRP